MNDIFVKAENLSKRFLVFKKDRTFFRALLSLIGREGLKKEFWALSDISFEVKKGDKLAIVGKNGSGKTTLLRILCGIYDKTAGDMKINGQPKALFSGWGGFNGYISVADNVYLLGAIHGLERPFLKRRIDAILKLAELDNSRFSLLKELSRGQCQRLAISVFFQVESDFLIYDESLSSVDQAFEKKCEPYFRDLSNSDKTVIMTSHDNRFLKKYCKNAIWLEEGRIRMRGETGKVIDEYCAYQATGLV